MICRKYGSQVAECFALYGYVKNLKIFSYQIGLFLYFLALELYWSSLASCVSLPDRKMSCCCLYHKSHDLCRAIMALLFMENINL